MRWLPDTAFAVLRKGSVRLALAGLALAVSLSFGASLALQARTETAGTVPAALPAPLQVSFQSADAASSAAQTVQGNRDVRNSQATGRQLSRAQAVAIVQHRYRARVVRTHLVQAAGGRPVYEFRLLSSGGMVWTVRIDAQSGAEVP